MPNDQDYDESDPTTPKLVPVLVVVNHCDNDKRLIGTDKLLQLTQDYGFSLIELSSLSGVNLNFLIDYILNHAVPTHQHKDMDTLNVIEEYKKETRSGMDRLKDAYGRFIKVFHP